MCVKIYDFLARCNDFNHVPALHGFGVITIYFFLIKPKS